MSKIQTRVCEHNLENKQNPITAKSLHDASHQHAQMLEVNACLIFSRKRSSMAREPSQGNRLSFDLKWLFCYNPMLS